MGTDIAENRQARRNYLIEDTLETGMVLFGSEVKSMRAGQANIVDAHAYIRDNELWLSNLYVAPYNKAPNAYQHEPKRLRKLLARGAEIRKLATRTKVRGYTLVPLKLYFDSRGRAKCLLGVGKGKTHQDQRMTVKDREWGRDQRRILRDRNR
ncbi:MAG: SsrA-binding protein SmpB [Alphaproteobacteria bacterium]|nr:SsrA-binding protein SmpB [Alphaproteobacteria bacterium]